MLYDAYNLAIIAIVISVSSLVVSVFNLINFKKNK